MAAIALVCSYELLITVIRSSHVAPDGASGGADIPDPLQDQAIGYSLIIWRRIAFFQSRDPRAVSRWPALGAAAA